MSRTTQTWMRFALAMVAACCFDSSAWAQDVRWLADYNAARQEARETQRPLVLDFGTVNCTWCRKLDATTLRDPGVVKLLQDRFVAVRIDAGKDIGLVKALGINAYPTLVFAGPDGKILGQHEGYMEPASFTQHLQKTLRECGAASPVAPAAPPGTRLTVPPTNKR